MAKKKFQVVKATTREIPGVMVGGRRKYFKPNGTLDVDDAGEAAEIDKVLGMKGTGEVVVTSTTEKEIGHTYTFGSSRKFADAWDDFKKRQKQRKTKPKRNAPKRRTSAEVRTHGVDP